MPTCFVVMGYGKMPDHEQGRTFDLDKSYHYIIKPAVQRAGYDCDVVCECVSSPVATNC